MDMKPIDVDYEVVKRSRKVNWDAVEFVTRWTMFAALTYLAIHSFTLMLRG
jgi:hypothetical protein